MTKEDLKILVDLWYESTYGHYKNVKKNIMNLCKCCVNYIVNFIPKNNKYNNVNSKLTLLIILWILDKIVMIILLYYIP